MISSCLEKPSLPPVTDGPTDARHPGKFVWFDLLTEDPAAAERFYAGVFGWTFEDSGARGYRLIRSGGLAIGGLAETDDRDANFSESRWLATLSVEDVDVAVSRVKAGGGEVLVEPVDVKRRGRVAAVRDAQGAVLVLIRTEAGDPKDGTARPEGTFLWTDLWTEDAGGARDPSGDRGGARAENGRRGRRRRGGGGTVRAAQTLEGGGPVVRRRGGTPRRARGRRRTIIIALVYALV